MKPEEKDFKIKMLVNDLQIRDEKNDTILSHEAFENNGKPTVLLFCDMGPALKKR